MEIHGVPAEAGAVRRYVDQLWVPYHRDLAATVDAHELADLDREELVAEEVAFRIDRLADEDNRAWIAVEGGSPDAPFADADASLDDADASLDDADPARLADADASLPDADASLDDADAPRADTDGSFVGFVTATVDPAPPVFDRPDSVVVGDLYVDEAQRGTGLARGLVERTASWAREGGCTQLALDVDVDNDRALAFYEKLGFERARCRMVVGVDAL